MWADQLFQFDFSFSEFWLPLAIGICVGSSCAILGRRVFSGHKAAVSPPPPRKEIYDPFVQGSQTEQRKVSRREGNPTAIFYARPQFMNNRIHAWVMNRSVAGVCLWLGEDIDTGTVLSILPVNAPPVTPWIDIEVCNCRPRESGFEVGCKFVKSPPSLILMQFG